MLETGSPTIGVFASDQGPGDAARTAIMSDTGNMLARNGATLLALAERDMVPLPLLSSALAAGGKVELVCDKPCNLPPTLKDSSITIIPDRLERTRSMARRADCFVILPGSLSSATSHFLSISDQKSSPPMVFLNQNRAFEIVRGFSADVFVHTFPRAHRQVLFAETVEEIWPRVAKLIGEI